MIVPFQDPQSPSAAVKKLWTELANRRNAKTALQVEEQRIKAAERFKEKYKAYFPDDGPLRRELYPKQMKFFAVGSQYRERALIAGNRTGKTDAGAYETTMHLTGLYPDWWTGKRFDRPTQGWAAGNTNTTTRDILQAKLIGRITKSGLKMDDDLVTGLGTGMIPGAQLLGTRPRSGIPDAVEIIYVKHVSGGTSTLHLKSYEQGRTAFEGTEKDFIWLDEETPEDIYTECLLRTMTTSGVVYLTFTPLEGLSQVVMKFLPGGTVPKEGFAAVGDTRYVIMANWDEAPHLSDDAKKELWQTIPAYQRDARTKGIPQLGSGAIYPVPESEITVAPFTIPPTWKRCYALDVGWNRTAAVWLAQNPQSKVWYGWSEHYVGRSEPGLQVQAIRARGRTIPGVIDPASRGRSQVDGRQLIQDYRDLGLDITEAKNAVEAGLYDVWQMLVSGQLKIFDNLLNLLEEYRVYRRDEKGHVVKEKDHLMDALRYAIVSGRDIAKPDVAPPSRNSGARGWEGQPGTDPQSWMS